MAKRRSKKQALMASILSLILCISMLLGTTMAWFTDTVSNTGNRIQTGTLKVNLLRYDEEIQGYADISNGVGDIFTTENQADTKQWPMNGILWEPGKTQVVYLAVENAGKLALNYNILLDVTNAVMKDGEVVEDDSVALEKALTYAIVPGIERPKDAAYQSWQDILKAAGDETDVVPAGLTVAAQNGALEAEKTDYFALAVHMNEEAGNEYQDRLITIDISVVARQMASENDSFGNEYDADAFFEASKIGDVIYIDPNVGTKFSAFQYSDKGSSTTDVGNGRCLAIQPNGWIEFKLDIPEDGYYMVDAYASFKGTGDMTFKVLVDGEEYGEGSVAGSSGYYNFTDPHELGLYEFTKGLHTLKIVSKTASLHLDSFSLEPVEGNVINIEPNGETKFSAFQYSDKGNSTTDVGNGRCLAIQPSGWIAFKLYIPEDGNYMINAYASFKESGVTKTLKVLFDGEEYGEGSVAGSNGWYNFTDPHELGLYEFTKGLHTLKIVSKDVSLHVDSFSLKNTKGEAIPDTFDYESLDKESPEVYASLYVASGISAAGEGSETSPFGTLEDALAKVAEINDDMTGDIVINIAPGYYELSETLKITNKHSGKNGYNVIFRGTGESGETVISGGSPVTGWEQIENSVLWRAPLTTVSEVRNLYVNDYPAIRARSKYLYTYDENYIADGSSNSSDGLVVDGSNFLEFSRPDELETVWEASWMHIRVPVESVTYAYEGSGEDAVLQKATLVMKQPVWTKAITGQNALTLNSTFYIENAMELLDEPGEFYYDSQEKYIYYYPYTEEKMNEVMTYVGKTETMLDIRGESKENKASNLVFDNLSFKYGAWNEVSGEGMATVQADCVSNFDPDSKKGYVPGGYKLQSPGQFVVNNTQNLTVKNCEFVCLGSSALQFYDAVTGVKVEGNVIRDISGTAIIIGTWLHATSPDNIGEIDGETCKHFMVRNNVIRRVANEYFSQTAISIYFESYINIEHNDIQHVPYTAITAGWGWQSYSSTEHKNINIAHNKITDVMEVLNDGAHIYTLGNMNGSTIAYNYLADSHNIFFGGIYLDAGSANITVHDNVSRNNSRWIFLQQGYGVADDTVYHNYSDTSTWTPGSAESLDNTTVEEAILISEGNIPEEAQEIINAAGVESEYSSLVNKAVLPAWKEGRTTSIPDATFGEPEKYAPTYGWIQAEDYLPGENNETYYDTYNTMFNNAYRVEGVGLMLKDFEYGDVDGYIVHETFPGEWLTYKALIPEDGKYQFKVKYSHGYSAGSSFKLYVDDELKGEYQIQRGENKWKELVEATCAELEMTKGEHLLKFEFTGDGFYLDALGFFGEAELDIDSDLVYDEGIITN